MKNRILMALVMVVWLLSISVAPVRARSRSTIVDLRTLGGSSTTSDGNSHAVLWQK